MLAAALDYAQRRGWRVLPLAPRGKQPILGSDGKRLSWEDASADPAQIAAWWEREPTANVGVACVGGLVVLDVDGEEGELSLSRLVAEHGPLPVTLTTLTGRGRHLYFRHDGTLDGWRWGGLELKARGYVVAPPSRHPSGRVYHHPERELEPAPLAAWLARSPRPVVAAPAPVVAPQAPGRLAKAGRAALDGELGKLAQRPADAGTGRHTAVFAAAAALGAHVAAGSLDEPLVRSALEGAALRLGLAANGETAHQIDNGLARGRLQPYQLADRPARNGTVVQQAPTEPARRRLRALAGLELRAVEWLWDERVPLGKLTVLAGIQGQGKSMLSCWLAARASRGLLPGNLYEKPVNVVIASGEDDPEDTIYPRLIRTGADFARVFVLDMRDRLPDGTVLTRSVVLPDDAPEILEALDDVGARLLVLDPIGGLISMEHSNYNSQHVRHALGPLKAAMEERHASTVLIQHVLAKSQATDPLQRIADSHAYTALPRSVLMFGPDPEDEQGDRGPTKALTVVKSNLATSGEHGLRFTILDQVYVSDGRGGLSMSAGIRLDGPCETTASETLASSQERSALREAIDFVRTFLADGARQSAELFAAANDEGVAPATLKRARAKVCRRAYRDGDGPWMVALRVALDPLAPLDPLPGPAGAGKGIKGIKGIKGEQGGTVIQFGLGDDPDSDDA
jgi:hypothetical protein